MKQITFQIQFDHQINMFNVNFSYDGRIENQAITYLDLKSLTRKMGPGELQVGCSSLTLDEENAIKIKAYCEGILTNHEQYADAYPMH